MRAAAPLLLLLLLLLAPGLAAAQPVDVVFPTISGDYVLTIDPARLSEAQMRDLVVLSPHLSGWTSRAVVPRLETCIAGDADYLDCAARAPSAPAFLWNARVNVRKGIGAIAALDALRHPRELEPVVDYLRRSMTFSLWLEETRLSYYETWDERALARPYAGVDPSRACRGALDAVAAAVSRDARHEVAALGWHNCVNTAVRQELGSYPLDAWESFLAAYGIRERIVEPLVPVRR